MEKTGFCDVGCGSELFWLCFWTLSFSCESAAEYAGNSGLLTFFMKIYWKKTKSKESKI